MSFDNDFGITDELMGLVKRAEDWSSLPYVDPLGKPTIGWGHLLPDLRHPPITPDEGEKLLRQDLRNARDALLALSPSLVHTTPARMAALTDFAFNLGAGHYARSTLRRRVQASDWPAAATEIQRWHFGHAQDGTVLSLPGLVTRRATEAAWLTQG